MRAFALLLILANICFFFWSHYIDVPEAAPLAAALPEAKRPPPLLLAKERQAQAGAASSAARSVANELTCISVGPFGMADEAAQVTRRLQEAGFSTVARTEQGEVFAGYWVSLPALATRADAEQALKRLHAADITDAYILPDDAAGSGTGAVLSLGLFSDQARAIQRRDAIAKLGFAPTLQNRMRNGEVHWLDVSLQEPGQLIDPSLLQPETGGIVRLETRACPTPPADNTQKAAAQSSSKSSR